MADTPTADPELASTSTDLTSEPLFGPAHASESHGSLLFHTLLPASQSATIFTALTSEITWSSMHHHTGAVPRLVCCQASTLSTSSPSTSSPSSPPSPSDSDPTIATPVYRHPSDRTTLATPWTPAVARVRRAAERAVGHPLNHALVQLYRSGRDYISEHSDKTLDVVPGSRIINVSFGARRTMRLRTKRAAAAAVADGVEVGVEAGVEGDGERRVGGGERTTFRVPMPHNSMLAMTLETNAEYLHGINADRRLAAELSEEEKAYGGERISLTFRQIGTFLSADGEWIWGQGAKGKTRETAERVVNGDAVESEKLLFAFGKENQGSKVAWEEIYGEGSNVLHLR